MILNQFGIHAKSQVASSTNSPSAGIHQQSTTAATECTTVLLYQILPSRNAIPEPLSPTRPYFDLMLQCQKRHGRRIHASSDGAPEVVGMKASGPLAIANLLLGKLLEPLPEGLTFLRLLKRSESTR